jgi:glutathione S-transferase
VILIGMFDSPFVRRVAVSMNLLGVPFEHRNWSVGKDFELIRQFNPLGRVPALVQTDGDTLVESGAILDFLDERAGAERALLPRSGESRREALRVIAIATGAAEKGVGLAELDRLCQVRAGEWLIGDRISQADITSTCVYTFLSDALAINRDAVSYPGLGAVAARCEAMPEFRSVKAAWFPPNDH